jgi:hypothetical protein
MRRIAGVFLLAASVISNAGAQNGWLPPSREVERPFEKGVSAHKQDLHTAIRPWRMREVLAIVPADTAQRSILPVLDRWAGSFNGRRLRWGPLLDASLGVDPQAENALFHRTGAGLWLDADAGKTLNFHLDGQAWSEGFPRYLERYVAGTGITPGEGYAYGTAPAYTHFDVNGHVSWDPGRYFNLTAGRGRNSFGEGHRSLLLSTEAQGYPYLRITTTLWKIKYVNLFAAMNDIRGADGDPTQFKRKYAAMHYLSWNATRRLNVALFEAIIFDGGSGAYRRGFDVSYLNPIIFYRPIEFNLGSPDNALLGAAINVKVGRNTLLYSQFVLDEFLWYHVRNGTGWYANKQSVQLGAVARDAFQVPGLTLRGEWNYIRPYMYTHINNLQNYAHMGQPLAHPYGSNVHEFVAHAEREQGRLLYGVRLSHAYMGADSVDSYGNNIFRPETDRPRHPAGNPMNFGYYSGHHFAVNLLHAEFRGGYLLDRNTGTRLEVSYLLRHRTQRSAEATTDHVLRLGIVCHFRDRHPEQDVRYFLR